MSKLIPGPSNDSAVLDEGSPSRRLRRHPKRAPISQGIADMVAWQNGGSRECSEVCIRIARHRMQLFCALVLRHAMSHRRRALVSITSLAKPGKFWGTHTINAQSRGDAPKASWRWQLPLSTAPHATRTADQISRKPFRMCGWEIHESRPCGRARCDVPGIKCHHCFSIATIELRQLYPDPIPVKELDDNLIVGNRILDDRNDSFDFFKTEESSTGTGSMEPRSGSVLAPHPVFRAHNDPPT